MSKRPAAAPAPTSAVTLEQTFLDDRMPPANRGHALTDRFAALVDVDYTLPRWCRVFTYAAALAMAAPSAPTDGHR
jgi:hypothetical protein